MTTKRRVLVIGLDGVPLKLIRTWAEAGHLPTLHTLMQNGTFGNLRSTTPPTSGPSWSSFMTGKNPGKTGIYDFLYRQPSSYNFPPVSANHRQSETIWSLLSQAGKKVGVFNVPVTYPVEAVNGCMVSGFMTPYSAHDFTYPKELRAEIQQQIGDYAIYPQVTFSEHHADDFFEASRRLLEMRTRTARWLMQRDDWDFFMTVFFDTDRILHQTWHYLDATHPWRQGDGGEDKSQPVLRYFQQLDASIGQILSDQMDENTTVIILSDHGMGAAHNFVILNNWLVKAGLLHFKRDLPSLVKHAMFKAGFTLKNIHEIVNRLGLARHAEYKALYSVDGLLKRFFLSFRNVDWSRTKAYSFGRHTGPIYVNLKGREPQGSVNPGAEYEAVRQEITALARDFRDPRTGQPLIGRIVPRDELYTGPSFDSAPDLTLFSKKETDIFFGLADFGDNRLIAPVYRYSGMHRDYGMLIASGKDIRAGAGIEGANIWDLAPTILYLLGVDIPRDMDGRVLQSTLTAYDAARHTFSDDAGSPGTSAPDDSVYSEQEESEVVERLRALGYLG